MQEIHGRAAALAVLTDPTFVVPPVPQASTGVAWLRATVVRFSVLRDDPPVPATRRQATVTGTVAGMTVEAGALVRVPLAGELAFGVGPRRCPGRAHALALVAGAHE
ncbi:hypothetical protein ACFFMR_24540 [Micromonospora andamanensis]|uniref:Cytochrome P450 n=1 Tax=Micromonospora andamanensis TaxID=1287068 RepID=A0ABQ4I4T5_9ACTN|nr:hypothetical protein [Micromonospora andamanensis]GIJ12919.1 hypothetical protein Van01_61330 [Micromonospora andamanensis]